jgi:hypothetical protein
MTWLVLAAVLVLATAAPALVIGHAFGLLFQKRSGRR